VAEANMIGVAAGLAMAGLRPVAYTINSFIATRCLEQIRLDVCYQNLPVVIVGVGSGLGYASLGATHHSCEDMAFMRAIPNMTVVAPGDPFEVRGALRAALAQDGPVYIRMGKKGEPKVHDGVPADFALGKGLIVAEGSAACLLAAGTVLPMAVEAGRRLGQMGLPCRVVSLHTVKPLDEALLTECCRRYPVIATIEEHSVIGGLGAAIAVWRSDCGLTDGRLLRFGTQDQFMHAAGDEEYAREYYGLTLDAITDGVRRALAATAAV